MTDILPRLTRAELTSQIYSITQPRVDQKTQHVEAEDVLRSWYRRHKVTFSLSRQIMDCDTSVNKHPGFYSSPMRFLIPGAAIH